MLSKIKNIIWCLGRQKIRNGEIDSVVTLLDRLILYNSGLASYTTTYKVHWTAHVLLTCFIIACVLQIIALFMGKDDPDRLFECFSVLSFCAMGMLKLLSLRKNHRKWRKLLTQITILENTQLSNRSISYVEYQSDSEDSDNFSEHISIYTKKFRGTSIVLTRIYSFTAFLFILSPFAERIICEIRGVECVGYPHVFPGWTPLDDFSIFGYLITVLCEVFSAVYCVCVHMAFDLTVIGIMIFVCGQFSLLRDYSSRIGGKGGQCNLSMRRDERARFRIIRCHDINLLLVNSITELDMLLKNIIGVYFFVATLTLCSVAVRLKSEDMGVMQLVSLIQYMCGTLTQLFLFCRYGDAVLHESTMGMGEGPFAAASWCLSPRVRRDLSMLSAGMMSQRHLRAGPFSFIDLPSFIQVVRAAYSYYAVLGKKE
uniref:Odorant receptor n=2 Tax=Helicoverpa armigera TaxID=29058 RepID=A0A1W5T541_HELAM|nr:olfactory receptor 27 [Helicoverpa armigera]